MNKRALTAILTGLILTSTLSGCSSILGKSAVDLPLVPQLSEKEVIDYYKQSLAFDTVATKNVNVQEVKYEAKNVTDSKANELKALVSRVESALGGMTYSYSPDLDKVLDESTFHYVKALLNDKKLTGSKVVSTKEALGYYFVDVEYAVGPRSIGNLTPQSSLLGLHGAFTQDYLKNDSINNTFIKQSVASLNRYYTANRLNKSITFDQATSSLTMTGSNIPSLDFTESTVQDNSVGQTKPGQAVTPATTATQPKQNRAPRVDAEEFNNIAGASKSQSSYMPKLGAVYQVPANEGTISGIGIYPSGDGGLRRFGYNRSQLSGKMTLRYVFKANVTNPSEILGVNVYPINSETVSGINANTENVTVPDFLMTEFQKVIERSDRAISDTDLTALMSGSLYSDAGMGVLTGYSSQYTNLLRNMSTIRRVVARDTKNSAYLLEVETIRQEGPRGVDTYGTYRDKNYVVIEQVGNKFVITDTINMTRQMTKEPSINPDSSITKRLVALNLAGAVPEESKKSIQSLMDNFYQAGTARVLTGPKEAKIDGKTVKLERGMYDCFNSDTSMLATSRKEYLNSTLREILVKNGVDTDAKYAGIITEWIGGADNQAELTTEEVVTYDKKNTGHYMQVYYLVSNMNGKWVIDDMKIIQEEDKTGDELKQIVDRIAKK